MKVHELITELQKLNQELDVVITVADVANDGDAFTYDDPEIDLGWEPSGVVSLNCTNIVSM